VSKQNFRSGKPVTCRIALCTIAIPLSEIEHGGREIRPYYHVLL